MDFSEPEHLRHLRDMLQRFVEKEMPRSAAREWDKNNHFPREIFKKLADLGVMGLTVPEEYGGAGRDILATMVVVEELSRRSLAVSVPYLMATCYAGMNIEECATPEQKKRLLPRVVDVSQHVGAHMGQQLVEKFLPRLEVQIEGTLSKAGQFRDLGNRSICISILPDHLRGRLEYSFADVSGALFSCEPLAWTYCAFGRQFFCRFGCSSHQAIPSQTSPFQ